MVEMNAGVIKIWREETIEALEQANSYPQSMPNRILQLLWQRNVGAVARAVRVARKRVSLLPTDTPTLTLQLLSERVKAAWL